MSMEIWKLIELNEDDQAITINMNYTKLCSDTRAENGYAVNSIFMSLQYNVFKRCEYNLYARLSKRRYIHSVGVFHCSR